MRPFFAFLVASIALATPQAAPAATYTLSLQGSGEVYEGSGGIISFILAAQEQGELFRYFSTDAPVIKTTGDTSDWIKLTVAGGGCANGGIYASCLINLKYTTDASDPGPRKDGVNAVTLTVNYQTECFYDGVGSAVCPSLLSHPATTITASPTIYVSDTPLPATWSMMLAGLGVVGFFAYRRRKQNAFASA